MLSALFKWLVNASAALSTGLRRQLTLRGTATSSVAVKPHSHAEPLLHPLSVGPGTKARSQPTQGSSLGVQKADQHPVRWRKDNGSLGL